MSSGDTILISDLLGVHNGASLFSNPQIAQITQMKIEGWESS